MIRIPAPNQITIESFKTPFEIEMDPDNRWVRMAHLIPWEKLTNIYSKSMSDFGRPGINGRIIIGSVIIKSILALSDEETMEQIRENMYMQYFLGYSEYKNKYPFDSSLFVSIRGRMSKELMREMNTVIIQQGMKIEEEKAKRQKTSDKEPRSKAALETTNEESKENLVVESKGLFDDEVNIVSDESKDVVAEEAKAVVGNVTTVCTGVLILDATVSDQYIKYPTDLELLQDCREKSEGIIDFLHKAIGGEKKPRTYREKARKQLGRKSEEQRKEADDKRA